jgi:endonuclease/exonuclease/phosphatase (EEP) superfamily protein YafD
MVRVPWWLKALRMMFFGLGACVAIFMIFTLFARVSVVFEICCHFYLQYLVLMSISVAGLLLLREFKGAAIMAPFLLAAIVQVAPFYFPHDQTAPTNAPTVTVMAFNVNTANPDFDDVANQILTVDPDVVSVEETSNEWLDHLQQSLSSKYPHSISFGQNNNFGIGLFSKYPIENSKIDPLFSTGLDVPTFATAVARINIQGKKVAFVAVHPPPPITELALSLRTRCMSEYEKILRTSAEAEPGKTGRYVLLGDLNCSPWSPYFSQFLSDTRLQNSALGFGTQASWPSAISAIEAPIDHILTSSAFRTLSRSRGPACGSDHFPIWAKLAIIE